jgi:penicillin amidase
MALLLLVWAPRAVESQGESFAALREQARAALAQTSGEITTAGLERPVEVLRDAWGIPHIYAQTPRDLFFAQGFVAAQDRLWQLDLWRRKAEGRLAEILGPEAAERDRFARLMRFRGDWDAEWKSYSPDTKEIVEAFVAGINAHIASLGARLPIEFRLLGIRPQPWKPEVVVSRLVGFAMSGNAGREVLRAELIARLGRERVEQLLPTDPRRSIELPEGLDLEGIDARVLDGLAAAAGEVSLAGAEGSNNWAIRGARTKSGKPILANDPHRALLLPSLRYLVHLSAPGWNVIGAGEPALPGISIGHNGRIAFGLTIFSADQQDLYVERTHPDDPHRYADTRAPGGWRQMEIIAEEIRVRGEKQPRRVELKYTRNGPVIYEDRARQRAFVLRWAGSEPGTAGYLGGLAISRAQSWAEFRRALESWKLPGENFVYADAEGNIGYQAAALVPRRSRGDGLLPVPAHTGEHEWKRFFSLDELPHEFNPARHYVATANHKTLSEGEKRVIGFDWAAPYRIGRVREVLETAREHTPADSAALQADVVSLPARELLTLLDRVPRGGERRQRAIALLREWNQKMEKDSAAAAIFAVWLDRLREPVLRPLLPADIWPRAARYVTLPSLLRIVRDADAKVFGDDAEAKRNLALAIALDAAMAELERRFGPEMKGWRWGALHTAEFRHALAQNPARRELFNRGPVERPGDANTVNAAGGGGFRQSSGASFRMVIDLADWDNSTATSVPGQSGQPLSPHYDDLLESWAADRHFPLLYSRAAVEKHTRQRLLLKPRP